MPDALSATTGSADADVFRQIAGAGAVTVDLSRRALLSQDIWAAGESVAELVVAPGDTSVLAAVVAAAAARGFAIAIRGGGMSYTRGYVPGAGRTLLLDLSRVDRVLEVRPEDMTVTVQAGCTWKTLHEALAPLGLRTPFLGAALRHDLHSRGRAVAAERLLRLRPLRHDQRKPGVAGGGAGGRRGPAHRRP
jgi:FAD/FMN-containing dehydrogenase